MNRLVVGLLWCTLIACAHSPPAGNLEGLRSAVDTFHQRIRWQDLRGASELIVPERRQSFLLARQEASDEKNLSISDYLLEEAQLGEGGRTARVTSRISWVRLPSVSQHSELVTSLYVFRTGTWLLARQQAGPFPELAEVYVDPPAGQSGTDGPASIR